jgi:hypothetical protein
MKMRTLMVLLGAAGILSLSACEIKECDENDTSCVGGAAGNGGTGGSGDGGAGGGTGGSGDGGAGGMAQKQCACGNYITDPTVCPGGVRPESVDLYNAYFDCVCGKDACGTDSMGKECADNVCDTASNKPATPECETCRINSSMTGKACYDTFMACTTDTTND